MGRSVVGGLQENYQWGEDVDRGRATTRDVGIIDKSGEWILIRSIEGAKEKAP